VCEVVFELGGLDEKKKRDRARLPRLYTARHHASCFCLPGWGCSRSATSGYFGQLGPCWFLLVHALWSSPETDRLGPDRAQSEPLSASIPQQSRVNGTK
jgi:hypothetical protein